MGSEMCIRDRCSVIAAANPIYGNYDHSQPVNQNINLPDSLLSRFDLLFIVLDQSDSNVDRIISSHVLNMHANMTHNGQKTNLSLISSDANVNSSGQNEYSRNDVENMSEKLPKQFLQKYLYYMKMSVKPTLTSEAENKIAEQYSMWRLSLIHI